MTDTKANQPEPSIIIVSAAERTYSYDRPGERPPAGYTRSTRGQRAAVTSGYRYEPFAWGAK